ncbi:MAG TPA: hypothetical protein VFD33_04405 [Bacillota bacterium]|nr:hypothetical protein [Bacillota bacterium]
MVTILLAAAALLVSYLLNKILLRLLKENAVIYGAPVSEELLKTLPAYILNRPILLVHFLFGVGEAIYDLLNSGEQTGRWAALVSIISHTLFGAITYFLLTWIGNVYIAMPFSMVIHCLWNYIVMRKTS